MKAMKKVSLIKIFILQFTKLDVDDSIHQIKPMFFQTGQES
jgi:hypothetical protein